MKRVKYHNSSIPPEKKMTLTLRKADIIRKVLLTAALTLSLTLYIVQAQYLYSDVIGKSALPQNKSVAFDPNGFTKLYDFYSPESGEGTQEIIVSGNWLYGINYSGGTYDYGTIFIIKTDGSDAMGVVFNGAHPNALVISGSVLYGTTRTGGNYNGGILYKINTDRTGFTKLYNFQKEYNNPIYSLILSGTVIYGIVFESLEGYGSIFKINTDGTGFTKLSNISKFPFADLLLYDNYLYGITWGGTGESGKIFKMKTDGTEFLVLHSFDNTAEGQQAYNALTLVENTLYGTTTSGGNNNSGTLFKINTDGTGFEKLYDFYSDGGTDIRSPLILSGSFLFGTASRGGTSDLGTIFRFNKDGSGFVKQHDFSEVANGMAPEKIVMSGDTIFGYTTGGGVNNNGTVYRFTIDRTPITSNEQLKTIILPINLPKHIITDTKENIYVENGKYIDLDTTFTIIGSVQYAYSWKVKAKSGFDVINKTAKITSDSTFYLFITTIEGCSYLDSTVVKVKSSTGIKEAEFAGDINIYPNPNDGNFQVNIPLGYKDYSYEIYDISGTKITIGNISCQTDDCLYNFRLNDTKPGVYTLVISQENMVLSNQRFIIAK